MKTIREWFTEGVTKVRLPKWNEWAYLEFSGTPDGMLHPWAYLHDVGIAESGEAIFIGGIIDGGYEKWEPPLDYEERKREIYKSFDLGLS